VLPFSSSSSKFSGRSMASAITQNTQRNKHKGKSTNTLNHRPTIKATHLTTISASPDFPISNDHPIRPSIRTSVQLHSPTVNSSIFYVVFTDSSIESTRFNPVRWPSGLRRQLKVIPIVVQPHNRWSERAWVQIPLSSIYLLLFVRVAHMRAQSWLGGSG
jgi:hypothetical protein